MCILSGTIELKATVGRCLFYNGESMFGVYAFEPLTNRESVKLNNWGNFVVSGNCPELFVGKNYEIIIEPTEHAKYGKGYGFVEVKQKQPTTIEEQQAYLKAMLKEKQYNAIIEKYPNHKVLDLMREERFDYSDIKGIQEKTYQKIKQYLFAHLDIQQALVELKDLNISFKAMKKLIDHFGDARIVVQKIKENVYNLCEVKQFGFLKVDQYALNRGDDKNNKNRIVAGLKYILEEEAQSGHSWVARNSLVNKGVELLGIEQKLIEEVLHLLEDEKDFYFEDKRVSLYKYYFYEKEISKKLFKMLQTESNTNIDDIDRVIDQIEIDKDIKFTHEQRDAIKLSTENNVLVINGKGGTGKSFTVEWILKVLNKDRYCCCALSGKAARILGEKGLVSKTIHKMLEVDPRTGFHYNFKNKLPYDVVVLDEASMVNSYLFYSVVIALRNDAKLIIVGDNGQLPAISAGAIFDDILNAQKLPQQELTIVQRQASKSGILSGANAIREGNQINKRYDYQRKVYGELKDFVLIPMQNKENIPDLVLDICNHYKDRDINEFQVITGLKTRGNISVKKLNIELQKIFNDINKPSIKRGYYEYRRGDKIIHNGNNYNSGENEDISIFNGTLGRIVDIEIDNEKQEHKLFIRFEGIDEIIKYEKDDLDMVELAYAITVHRSQGSTIRNVLFVFDYSAYTLLSRQFIYTGITRASKGCVVVCENNALHHAISIDHGGIRNTWLKDLLMRKDVDR